MLSPLHHQYCQELLTALRQLQQTVNSVNTETRSRTQAFEQVQEVFQRQIANLTSDDLDPVHPSRIQPYLTEMHRQMRLLQMDVMFLQASRNLTTTQQRQLTMSDRIKSLISYCEALLQVE